VLCVMKSDVRHSMHLSIRFEQGSQINVCPHGRTTGGRSMRSNELIQITQWNENGAVAMFESVFWIFYLIFDPILILAPNIRRLPMFNLNRSTGRCAVSRCKWCKFLQPVFINGSLSSSCKGIGLC
jgi:hypothetical protein